MPLTFEVLSKGEISGPWYRRQLLSGVRRGKFLPEDSYRRKGALEWRSLGKMAARENLLSALLMSLGALYIIGLGVFVMIHGLKFVKLAAESPSWPSVAGKITYAAVESPGSGLAGIHYSPQVCYLYHVGTKSFFGSIIYPGCSLGTKSWAQDVINRHPSKSSCRVFYQPERVSYAVLEPGLAPHTFQITVFGLVAVYVGTLVGFVALTAGKGKDTPRKATPRAFLQIGLVIAPAILGFLLALGLP